MGLAFIKSYKEKQVAQAATVRFTSMHPKVNGWMIHCPENG
jgi:hypothetical protein